MKRTITVSFLLALTLIFSNSIIYAEDRTKFKIEGMFLEESLLNHFSKEQIEESEIPLYEDKKYKAALFSDISLIYDDVLVDFKANDKKFLIQGLTGFIEFKDIDSCYKKQNQIEKKISSMIDYDERIDWGILKFDPGGKGSTYRPITFDLPDGSRVAVDCYHYAESKREPNLKVHTNTKLFLKYLNLEAESVKN
tara:strand:+ start:522 stop:1106 length:585 start_codon:yes stop_codon:yes gene_type:complete